MEKAGELVGLEPKTIQGWVTKRPAFGAEIKKARKAHEISLLRSIEIAGEKSWQAKAWLAERVYNYAVPSSRLEVAGAIAHGATPALAQMLAGLNKEAGNALVNVTSELIEDKEKVSSGEVGHKKTRRVPRYSKRPTPPRPPALPPPPSATHNTPQKIATKNKKACESTTTATNESTQEATQQTTGTA